MANRSTRAMTPDDWPDVARIYEEGIETGNATFETRVPEWEEWDAGHLETCRLVMEEDGVILGWAALSPVSRREVYRGVAEHSVYVAEVARGRGVGTGLLGSLLEVSEKEGFWTLQTAIFPENETSISLHEKHGFRVVGVRERLGRHRGRWRDVVLMERRSTKADQ
jgi:L-amino acid N-acyltransferase YncA